MKFSSQALQEFVVHCLSSNRLFHVPHRTPYYLVQTREFIWAVEQTNPAASPVIRLNTNHTLISNFAREQVAYLHGTAAE